jgi:rSAM/selenodomain-associated transferase 2
MDEAPHRVSVVVPTLDEEVALPAVLRAIVSELRAGDEVLVVDGGSRDGTVAAARAGGARVLEGKRGRGLQMNVGAQAASGDVLLFVHADTLLPPGWRSLLGAELVRVDAGWGRFDLALDERSLLLDLTAALINRRSRWTTSATGDQAIFVRRGLFHAVGGFREPRLFEDVDLVRRLRPQSPMLVVPAAVTTSARRWRNAGVIRTILKMWTWKALYLAGVPADALARRYDAER